MQKAKKNYSKEKAAEYYLLNKEAIKKGQKIGTKIGRKASKKKHQKKLYMKLKVYKDKLLLEKAKKR